MDSTITIEDTDEEVIDLDSSQDAINVTDNERSECSIQNNSLLNNNTNKTDIVDDNVDSNKNATSTETCDSAETFDSSDMIKPLLKVTFRDEKVSRQYSKRIKEFLEELVSSKIRNQENDNGLTLEVWDNDIDSTSQSIEITESEDSQDIICDTLFTVDTQPKVKDDLDVPTYGKKYENVFDKTRLESNINSKGDCPQRLTCFNCLGNHNLRECTKPRNYAKIDTNRKNFNMKGSSKAVRYHLEDNQKFGHIIPGQLSNNLRRALGLRENELPRHIYRMRILGYPPGWLEEARLQHSGLSLFNSDGVAEEDLDDEPGAIFEEGDRDQYDIKKIYDFPGFNVPAPPGTYDEHGKCWALKMPIHSKQRMLLELKGKRADDGYKRKKLKISNNALKDTPVPKPSEMEIEDVEESVVECVPINGLFVPPLPRESPIKPPEPPLSQPISEDSDYHSQELQFSELSEDITPSSRPNSPSLIELENIKKQLLVELQESNSNSNSSSKISSSNSALKSNMPPPNNESTPESNRIRQNGANTSQGSVKSIDLGTPVLQSTSPYNKLPPSEKFSKNICNLINFENLPDSTGRYEQMTGVLQKVRDTMAKLQQE
ncbi:zinc finger CCHC domain-containing protein 8 homolog [Xylocopa sonorina]|uniref:zinc finger CCHC domain-containing protein 8 homolog n=1 Tax=Xylocopa sonorina TaxID=1818115 RepID=UPI00403AF296